MNLKYLFDQPSLNSRQVIWLEFLCEFDLENNHIKGKENKVVNALSKKFHLAIVSTYKLDLRERILKALAEDEKYLQVTARGQQGKLEKQYEGYQLKEYGLLIYKGRMYIPQDVGLKGLVMDEMHQMPYSRHLGYHKTIAPTMKQYY